MFGDPAIFLSIDSLASFSGNSCLAKCYEANSELAEMVRIGRVGKGPSIRLCTGRNINEVRMMAAFFGMVDSRMVAEGGALLFNPTSNEILLNPVIAPLARRFFSQLTQKNLPDLLAKYPCLRENLGPVIWRRLGREKGVNKGSGVEFLAKTEGIDLEKSVAVGESPDDASFLEQVGRVGCPSSAAAECQEFVRSRGGRVSLYPYTQGVVDIVNWYLKGVSG